MKRFSPILWLHLCLVMGLMPWNCEGSIAKFSNLQCCSYADDAVEFAECRLKAVQRDVNELSIRVKMVKESNLTMRLQLMKKASGFKPFLYDVSADVCEYFKKRNHPFVNIVWNSFRNHSTGISKCPLSGELALRNFRFPLASLATLPLPDGEYGLFITVSEDAMQLATIKVYFILADYGRS